MSLSEWLFKLRNVFFLGLLFIISHDIQAQQLRLLKSNDLRVSEAIVSINGEKVHQQGESVIDLTKFCTLPCTLSISIRHISYEPLDTIVFCSSTQAITLYVKELSHSLVEFVVSKPLNTKHFGKIEINPSLIKKQINLFAQPDPIKYLHLLPGISTSLEGTSTIFIRGGGADETMVIYDGGILSNYSHLFGLVSAMNGYYIGNTELINGGVPASYGGSSSGYVVMKSPEPDTVTRCTTDLGLLSSSLSFVSKEHKKFHFGVAARLTYADKIVNFFDAFKSGFSDINSNLGYRISDSSSLKYSFYRSFDRYEFFFMLVPNDIAASHYSWKTNNHSLVYNKSKLNSELRSQISFNSLNSEISDETKAVSRNQSLNTIWHLSEWVKKNKTFVYTLGIDARYTFNQIKQDAYKPHSGFLFNGLTTTPFAAIKHQKANWTYHVGLRMNYFTSLTNSSSFYLNPEPRLSIARTSKKLDFQMAYDRQIQYLRMFTPMFLPLNFLYPLQASDALPPLISDQYSIDCKWKFLSKLDLKTSVFYKNYNNSYDLRDFGQFDMRNDPIQEITQTNMQAYGLELFSVWQPMSQTYIQLSYTLSRSIRQSAEINFGRAYPSEYDRPHILNAMAQFGSKNKKWLFNTLFVIQSNRSITMPVDQIYYISFFTDKNAFRLPAYVRWDLGLKHIPKPNKIRFQSAWNLYIYNVTNRNNVFGVILDSDPLTPGLQSRYVSLFPILPTISYQLNIR